MGVLILFFFLINIFTNNQIMADLQQSNEKKLFLPINKASYLSVVILTFYKFVAEMLVFMFWFISVNFC